MQEIINDKVGSKSIFHNGKATAIILFIKGSGLSLWINLLRAS